MENYWEEENPKYIDLKLKIEQIESRIKSGIITNSKTLSFKRRELKTLKKQLSETNKICNSKEQKESGN